MKSHVLLLGRVLADASTWCSTSTTRDVKYVESRVKHEGLSFLTITLPNFGSDFERCLDRGFVDSTDFQGFRRSGSLPAFLQGLTSLVFDKCCGVLLDEPSVLAIWLVRQVCYLFKKLEVPCSDARINAAFAQYIECEQSVRVSDSTLEIERKLDFVRVADLLFRDLFIRLDRKIYDGEIVPKHGPGATADRRKANAKYDNRLWTDRLEEFFRADEFLFASPSHYNDALLDGEGPIWLEPGSEIPVRVITVPKTLKAPRIIAIEPTHMQYVQQGIAEVLVEGIERDDILSSFIGFKDQTVNRDMACHGSVTGDLATLDLSEASDRVSNLHVRLLFGRNNLSDGAVQACRSRKADVPGYGTQTLAKFASMGSALTFPVEAMVFTTVVLLGIERELRTPLTRKTLKHLTSQVRVYGDDIIVPVRYVDSVVRELESFGFRVNGNKSFWTGKFRESCGGDFYDGFDVNVVKVRHGFPSHRRHARELDATVALRNQMYFSGLWATAEYLDEMIERLIPFPRTHPEAPGLGRHTFLDYQVDKWCPFLQRPLVKAAVVNSRPPRSYVSGTGALLKYFLKRGDEPSADRNHLERAGRPESSYTQLRWIPPY